MKNKLFLATLAMSVAVPAVVVTSELPVNAEDNKNVIKGFKDLPKTHWAYNDVMEMTKQGIIYGYTDGTFRPNESISRLHVAMMIERAKDLKPIRPGKEFKDVPKTHKYYQSVQNVYRAGIFDGKTSDTFGIDDKLTRAEMARVLVNTFEIELVSGYIFKDVYADHWAKDYIATVYQYGVAFGDTNGKYSPQAPVTRAEYSAFLYRALNLDKDFKPEKPLEPTPPTKPEPKPDPKPNPGYPAPGSSGPMGSTVKSADSTGVIYNYYKSLPGGGTIDTVIALSGGKVTIAGADSVGKRYSAQILNGSLSFINYKPELSPDVHGMFYDIGYNFKLN